MDLNSLSIEQKVGQLFFVGIPGPEVDDATKRLLDRVSPGGVCLFSRNIKGREQTREFLDNLRSTLPQLPLLSVDQEGGLVDRLRRIMMPMPAAASLRSAEDAAELGRIVGESLSILGFNMDFAPVVDVVDHGRAKYSNGLFTRPFGHSKEQVAEYAAAFLAALQGQGVLGCLKHFPGLGAAEVDSHEELPVVKISEDDLRSTDLFPYGSLLSQVDSVMVAHAAFPETDLQERDQSGKLLPSSLSNRFLTELLRGELGFDSLVVTDDLEMGAIIKSYGIGEACKMALNAGADMLAICADPARILDGYQNVLGAVKSGEISEGRIESSLERIAKTKAKILPPPTFDSARLDELSSQTAALNARLA